MAVDDRIAIRKFTIEPEVDFRFPRKFAVAFQLIAVQVRHQHLVRIKPPLKIGAGKARGDADMSANPHADVAAGSVGQFAVIKQSSDFTDSFTCSLDVQSHG